MKEGIRVGSWYNENSSSKSYLVYAEDDLSVRFDTVIIGMAANNSIDGIVPFVFSQQNSLRYVRFDITSKLTLPQLLEKTINKKRFISLLSSICTALYGLKNYMINDCSAVLDENIIYVDVSQAKAYMILDPVLKEYSCTDYNQFFRELVVKARFDNSEDTGYVAQILSLLNNGSEFSLSSFNKKLLSMLGTGEPETPARPSPVQVPVHESAFIPQTNQMPAMQANEPLIPEFKPQQSQEFIPQPRADVNIPPVSQVDAPVKKTKEKKSGIKSKLFGQGKSSKNKKQIKENAAAPADIPIPGAQQVVPVQSVVPQPAVQTVSRPAALPETYAAPVQPEKRIIPQPAVCAPAPLSSDDDENYTTLLSDESQCGGNPVLTRLMNGERIPISKDRFVIGKERNFVDYCVSNNSAISRSHAFIVKRDGLYYLVDTNSKNHTYINGMKLESNTEIQLHSADKIRFANEEFVFTL